MTAYIVAYVVVTGSNRELAQPLPFDEARAELSRLGATSWQTEGAGVHLEKCLVDAASTAKEHRR
jgi:hypothetical protein